MRKTHDDRRLIQVFLDTSRFIDLEAPRPGGGGSKDFYEGNNQAFREHKQQMTNRMQDAAASLRRSQQSGGFIKVQQKEEALAKSHRPIGSLFTSNNQFSLVGADSVGGLVFQATTEALDKLATVVDARAELVPKMVPNKHTGDPEPRVSEIRSELGGIEDLRLVAPSDRIHFSPAEAVRWMQQPNTIGGYIVELYKPDPHASAALASSMARQFSAGLDQIPGGLLVRPILPSYSTRAFGEPSMALSVQLTKGQDRYIDLPIRSNGESVEFAESSLPVAFKGADPDLSIDRHTELLEFLASQSLVRSVELPPVLETEPEFDRGEGPVAELPPPAPHGSYPVIGIIDGGVSDIPCLQPWKVGEAGMVPIADRDHTHGTFIAGLISGVQSLNSHISLNIEALGCKFYDIDLFPKRDLRTNYFTDIEELFDSLDEAIKAAKRSHSVRIFNLSFRLGSRSRLAYSVQADRLDRIARSNDVIFVVSAGNLPLSDCRPSWPLSAANAAAMLAGYSSSDQHVVAPSDHVFGLTVGAVNPPGVPGHEHLLPTNYTRRGPGVGGARKPDLAHYGGAWTTPGVDTGLRSLSPGGHIKSDCGTSFAAPLSASTLATLDHRLEGRSPRETLLALGVHRASRARSLNEPTLRHVSREFVGFGVAPAADEILNDDPHSVTLVFHDVLAAKHRLEFPFTWPQSLVNRSNSCRGKVEVTLCFTPPVDPDHGEEAIRVLLEAHVHQECLDPKTGELSWESQLSHDSADVPQGLRRGENYLIKTGLKWTPIKRYVATMPKGRGNTSNWRLSLDSLVRANVAYPPEGVRFTIVMTISDIAEETPIREEVRADITNRGLEIADITLAHRIRAR